MTLPRFLIALFSLCGLAFFAGCESHSLEETRSLHQDHGGHHEKHDDHHGEEKSHPTEEANQKASEEASPIEEKKKADQSPAPVEGEKGEARSIGL